MNHVLTWDVETTGLPLWREPSDHPSQPRVVQLAALLIDPETMEEVDSINLIVKPDGWIIPDEVAAIHGITTERAMDEGVPAEFVNARYIDLTNRAVLQVGHNISFDIRLMRIALLRAGIERAAIEAREQLPKFCTMGAASKIMKMAPTEKMLAAGFSRSKPPKLSEAYLFFFEELLTGAHDAMIDVRATARLYFHLQGLAAQAALSEQG